MLLSRRQLHALSRDPAVLWRAVLIILGAFFLTALWAGVQRPPTQTSPGILDQRSQGIREILQAEPLDRAALLRELRSDARRTALWQEHAETGDGEDGDPGQLNLPQLLALSPLPAAEQEYIGQMTQAELRRAIEEPAQRGGWEFERGLVDELFVTDIYPASEKPRQCIRAASRRIRHHQPARAPPAAPACRPSGKPKTPAKTHRPPPMPTPCRRWTPPSPRQTPLIESWSLGRSTPWAAFCNRAHHACKPNI